MRSSAAPGQPASAPYFNMWASRPSSSTASRCVSPHHSGPGAAESLGSAGCHRNTYLDAPKLLDETLRLCAEPRLRFAGRSRAARANANPPPLGSWPGGSRRPSGCPSAQPAAADHAHGARSPTLPAATLLAANWKPRCRAARSYQPMNVNFGLFPALAQASGASAVDACGARKRRDGKKARADRPRARRPRSWIAGAPAWLGLIARRRNKRDGLA